MKEILYKYFFFLKKGNIENFLNISIIMNILVFCNSIFNYYFLFSSNIDKDDYYSSNYALLALPMSKLLFLIYDIYLIKEFFPLIIKKYKAKELKYKPMEVYFFSTILCYLLTLYNLLFVINWVIISLSGYIKVFLYSVLMFSIGLYNYPKVDKRRLKKE